MRFFVLVALAALVATAKCCKTTTFTNAEIKASRYFSLVNDPDDIKMENPLTGCIKPTEELKRAVQVVVKNQKVPILHEGAVQDLEFLHVLKLEEDGIEEIKAGAFKNLPTIATLSLASNKLEEIPEEVFNNMVLKRLYLNDNRISHIAPGAFDNMPNLKRIDLDRNKLQEWNGKWFTNTPNIYYLSVTVNQITGLPPRAFRNFKGKHEEPGKTPLITSFYFANNKIEEIDSKAFKGLTQLDTLDFDQNNIHDIDPKVFKNFESIKNLMLNGNKITCLSEDFLEALPPTELVSLNENPLDCACLKEMKNWSKANQGNLKMNIRSIECMQERIRNVLDSVADDIK